MANTVTHTDLSGLPLVKQGKVRDLYELPEGYLIVATDRLSAFDVVFDEGFPGKGRVLTELTAFWFDHLADVIPNHLITCDVDEMPDAVKPHADVLRGRTMLVKKVDVLPVECIARGYLAGSGYKSYVKSGTVCGIQLPEGLQLSSRLPENLFTPSTKADVGHDENITYEQAVEIIGTDTAARLEQATLELFAKGGEYLAGRGIILCDTKFEFGRTADGEIILIDEALTPDSSRFWDKETYREGVAQDSFDKQIVRDHLDATDWDKTPPPPPLPAEVIEKTCGRYREIAERIIGKEIEG
ncbi:MAG: phosphoribosylaminoimidazolesuccinocarboxamide synthase [Planctomycetota bacterium]